MSAITANDLKTKGVSAVEEKLKTEDEVIITVRGQHKYVVMEMSKYDKLREYELEIALLEAKADIASGKYVTESVADHIKRISHGL